MNTRFTTVAGFLAAGVLLSGSAFAFAPEFQEDLPTVIITDKLPEAEQNATGVFDVNGLPSPTTEYVFRFSRAFDARDYFGDADAGLQGNSFASVKFRFNEFDYDSVSGPAASPNADGTLMLNGETASATLVLDDTDFDYATAPFLNSPRYTAADGLIDFRNIDFSGTNEAVNSGFSGIGAVTGQDITLSPVQQRWVQLYLQGNTSDEIGMAKGGFLVITTTDGQDELATSALTNPWDVETTIDTFGGWVSGSSAGIFGYSTTAAGFDLVIPAAGSYAFTPATTPAAGGTPSLALNAPAGTVGFGNWTLPLANGFSTTAGTLYRMRANVYSNSTVSRDVFRVSMGNGGIAVSTSAFNAANSNITNNPPSLPTSTSYEFLTYHLTRETGLASIIFDVVNANTAALNTGQNYTLQSLEISSADPEELGTPNVVLNWGGPVTVATGETRSLPAGSPTPFLTTAGTPGQSVTGAAFPVKTSHNPTVSTSATALTYSRPAGQNGTGFANFTFSGNLADAEGTGSLNLEVGKLYIMDVWARTTTPAATMFPALQPSLSAAASEISWINARLIPTIDSNPNPYALAAQDRAFSAVLYVDGGDQTRTTAKGDIQIQILSGQDNYPQTANVTISRIVIREYEAGN